MANSALNPDSNLRNLNEAKFPRSADDPLSNPQETLENISAKGRQLLEETQNRATNFLQENRIATLIGVAALAGVLGFFIGRRGGEISDQTEIDRI